MKGCMLRLNDRKTMVLKRCLMFSFLWLAFLSFSLFSSINLSNTSGESEYPAIAVNSAGEVMVVWTELDSGNMFYRIFRNGQWSAKANTGIASKQAWSNQLSVDSYDTFHASCADGRGSGARDIYYGHFTGSSWSASERVYYSAYNSAWNRIDVDTDNDIHVMWYHSYTPAGEVGSDIVTLSKSKTGNWPSSYENVSRTKSICSIHPAFGVRNGNIYACWMEGSSRALYFSEKSGGSWKNPKMIVNRGYYPDMEIDNSGNIHIVYSNKAGNFSYISRMSGVWQSSKVLSNGDAPLQFGDLYYNNGVLGVAWKQRSNGKHEIYTATKTPGGQWTAAKKVAGGMSKSKHHQVALDSQGYAHVVWSTTGVGGDFDVFYEKVSASEAGRILIEVNKSFLSFAADVSESPDPQTFQLRVNGDDSINYSVSSNKNWLSVSPTQGASSGEWDTITVQVDTSNFQYRTYSGTISIRSSDVDNSPVDINVSLIISAHTSIEVDNSSLDFAGARARNPDPQTFQLRGNGNKPMNYTLSSNQNWLTVSPVQGVSTGEWDSITVQPDTSNLADGTYNGRITIRSSDADNSPVDINVRLTVSGPIIEASKSSVDFSALVDMDPKDQTFKIKNSGDSILSYTISSNKSWLAVNPQEGTSSGEWDSITVKVASSSLKVGTYSGSITITSSDASNSPQKIYVNLAVKGPEIAVNKQSLDFETEEFKKLRSQSFLLRNSGEAKMDYTITSNKSWLKVSPQQGSSSGEWDKIVVELATSNFAVDSYTGTLTIKSPKAPNSPVKIPVSLNITKRESPYIQLDRTNLSFSALAAGDNPSSQSFKIRNYGKIALYYEVIADKDWIKVSPASGSSTGEWDAIVVSIDTAGFLVENQNGTIRVKSVGTDNSPQSIGISLDVLLPPNPYPPTNIQVEKVAHEGLMIKTYANRTTWQANPKNTGLFGIVKYKIFRKKNSEPSSAYVFIDEVSATVFTYSDGEYSSKAERDKYGYAITCIDSMGRESLKAEISGIS